jgi:hypothetical protein
MKKGQFALEFVILISFTIFFTAIFLTVIQKSYADAQIIKQEEQVNQIMRIIYNEVSLAESSPSGYTREFYIPTNINGANYNLYSTDGVDVVFDYGGLTYVFFLANSTLDPDHCGAGNCLLKPGYNTVRKECPSNSNCKLVLLLNS